MKDEYMVEKMVARIDGQQGWRIYKYRPGSRSEEGFYDNVAAGPGDNEEEALRNYRVRINR